MVSQSPLVLHHVCLRSHPVREQIPLDLISQVDIATVDTSDAKPREELNKLLRDIASLLQSDPDLFTNQSLEDLIPSVAEFISLSATLEDGTGSALEQRKDVLDSLAWALSLMQDLSDLPPVLQEQASHMR